MLSGEEMAARLATALQTPGKMQYQVLENEQGQLVFPAPPTPVLQVGNVDSAGRVRQGSALGSMPVVEDSAAGIASNTSDIVYLRAYQRYPTNPLGVTAAGVYLEGSNTPWFPITPVTATADGNGNPEAGAGVEIVPLSAGDRIDVALWWTVSLVAGAGEYIHRFRENTAAPGPVIPPWVGVVLPVAARETQPNFPNGARMMTTTVAQNFGIADGANGDWPIAATVTYWGMFRYI